MNLFRNTVNNGSFQNFIRYDLEFFRLPGRNFETDQRTTNSTVFVILASRMIVMNLIKEAELRKQFEIMDKDGGGFLDREEIV